MAHSTDALRRLYICSCARSRIAFFRHLSHNMSSYFRCTFLIVFYRWLANLHLHLNFTLSNRISWIRLGALSIFSIVSLSKESDFCPLTKLLLWYTRSAKRFLYIMYSCWCTYIEKVHCWARHQCAILHFILVRKIFGWFDWCYHSFHGQKCRQIGSVWWNED